MKMKEVQMIVEKKILLEMRYSEKSLQIWRFCSQDVAQAFGERAEIVLAVALMMGARSRANARNLRGLPNPVSHTPGFIETFAQGVLQTLTDSGRPRYAWQRELK